MSTLIPSLLSDTVPGQHANYRVIGTLGSFDQPSVIYIDQLNSVSPEGNLALSFKKKRENTFN